MGTANRLTALGTALGILALAVPAAQGAQPAAVPVERTYIHDGPDGRYLLGGAWLFRADPLDQGLAERWQRQPDLASWSAVTVPNAFNATDQSDASMAGSVGWYRKQFRLPDSPGAQDWSFLFESVNYNATVWLNGRPLGTHTTAFVPFELAAQRIKRNGLNDLVVRVDSRKGPDDLPSSNDAGWWNYGGILREVYLRRVGRLDARDVVVEPDLPCRSCNARLTVSVTVKNATDHKQEGIRGQIAGPGGFVRRLKFPDGAVPPHGFNKYRAKLTVKQPRLWSPEHPNLYTVTLSLGPAADPDQTYTVNTGIRSFRRQEDGTLLLNGRPLQLRGASMHEDSPDNGAALQPRQRIINMKLLRELNANFTRAHYPLHPQTLELADRYGIVVWSEIPVYQVSASLLASQDFRNRALKMLQDNIESNRNHPSIMAWSIANELPTRPGPGQELYITHAVKLAHQLDPSRLAVIDIPGYPTVEPQAVYKYVDAIGVNDYFGWYHGPHDSIVDRNGLSAYLDQIHAYYPNQGLVVTEVGAEANHDGPVTDKGTFAFQSDFLQYHMGVIASKPFVAGAIIWILRDFRVKPGWTGGNPAPDPPWNHKGLVNQYGQKKPAFDVVAQTYASTPWARP